MANFKPLNNYSLFMLDKLINKFGLKEPFLDVACGTGYVAANLAKAGWSGKGIDYSKRVIQVARKNLMAYPKVKLEEKSLADVKGKYKTVLMFDILEHIENDILALKKINNLLEKNGHLVIAGPSNHSEWRWDDEFYGHCRRYSDEELKSKLTKTGFMHIVSYDYSFPFFWCLRRIYTALIKKKIASDINERTKQSSLSFAWKIPIISDIVDKTSFAWIIIYLIQFYFFRNFISKGSSMMVLAKKI